MSFFANLETFGDAVAVEDSSGRNYSYNDLAKASNDLAAQFSTASKQLVLIYCKNSFETLVGYCATLRSGHCALLINADIDDGLAERTIQAYEPDYIWRAYGAITDSQYRLGENTLQHIRHPHAKLIHPDLGLLLSTSGSTGSPKMVRLKYQSLHHNAASIAEYLSLDESERPISTLPFNYSYGLSIVNSHLLVGATLILTNDSFVTREFWTFFKTKLPTSFGGVPFMYEMLERLRFERMDLPSLRYISQAGGKLPPERAVRFAGIASSKGIRFFIMYGQTEATARIAYVPPEHIETRYMTIGKVIPGGKLTLVNEHGDVIVEPNVPGELVYEGDNVMMGYAENAADLGLEDTLNGKLRTGDIGHYDDDRFIVISGRLKRFIKLFGNRVNLDEVETFLQLTKYDCACGGNDEKLVIAITSPALQKEIAALVNARYKFHPSVITFKVVEAIPRNESGKILYGKAFGAAPND